MVKKNADGVNSIFIRVLALRFCDTATKRRDM